MQYQVRFADIRNRSDLDIGLEEPVDRSFDQLTKPIKPNLMVGWLRTSPMVAHFEEKESLAWGARARGLVLRFKMNRLSKAIKRGLVSTEGWPEKRLSHHFLVVGLCFWFWGALFQRDRQQLVPRVDHILCHCRK